MSVVTLANGVTFTAKRGSTLLDAAMAQGVMLAHSCRTGRCGSCKARVVSGRAERLGAASSLSADEETAGWLLTCAHEATADLALDIEDLGALAEISVLTLPSRVDDIERLAPDVVRVTLRLPPTAKFRFVPGQYIDVTSPEGVKRSYSLASDATSPGRLELQIRRVEGGHFSAHWFERAKPNDLLRFVGPRGTFFLRPSAGKHIVFLATGTGIAPFKAMLSQIDRQPASDRPASVSLLWGGRRPEDLYWDPVAAFPWLRYTPVLSRADPQWPGACGHVQDVLLAANEVRLQEAVVYACGSEQMIHSAQQRLLDAGLPAKQFYYDAFVSSN